MTPLRRRMTEDLILRNRSPKTIRAYIGWVADFAHYFHTSPDHLGPEHVRAYLIHLVQQRRASWNVYKQARLALQFFHRVTLGRDWVVAEIARPKAPKKLPVALSQDEMARLLDALQNPKHRALLMTAYAGGLRLSEVARLRVEDIDSARMVIHVRQAKGHKDREQYGANLTPEQRRALDDLTACRTAALGGHVLGCPECGYQEVSYDSCGNRHCPKCQATAAARWLEAQAADLLDAPYSHVVFTLPSALGPMALSNPRVVYGLLMRAAAEALLEVAADPKHLGAEVGMLAVLHTWGQNLALHPHVHCVVTGGGLAPDGSRWVAGRDDFFLPVRVLSRVFRGKFLAGLRAAFKRGRLRFPGRLATPAQPERFRRLLAETVRTEWVVYARPPWGGPATVLKYLARYTHRAAISNRRLVDLTDGRVTFRWKDWTTPTGAGAGP